MIPAIAGSTNAPTPAPTAAPIPVPKPGTMLPTIAPRPAPIIAAEREPLSVTFPVSKAEPPPALKKSIADITDMAPPSTGKIFPALNKFARLPIP